MSHGIVDAFAYQEALLIEAVFGIAILTMIWVGFRRWLQHRERIGQRDALQGDRMERVEARLAAVEHLLSEGRAAAAAQIGAPQPRPAPDQP